MIDLWNRFAVGVLPTGGVVIQTPPRRPITRDEALNLAVQLCGHADIPPDELLSTYLKLLES